MPLEPEPDPGGLKRRWRKKIGSGQWHASGELEEEDKEGMRALYSLPAALHARVIVKSYLFRGNSLCAIKKYRNALCAPGKFQQSSVPLLQLFYVLHATAISLGSNAAKLQV